MFRKIGFLKPLIFIMFCTVAQAQDNAEHYFELKASLSKSSTMCEPFVDWADVTLKANDTIHTIHFVNTGNCAVSLHRFSLNEINMGQEGNIQIVDFKYHEVATDKVFTIPFADNPMCNIHVKSKDAYTQSTLTQIYVTYRHCDAYYTVAIEE